MHYDPKWEQKTEQTHAQKVISLAADLIEKHGHCQNRVRDERGAMCLVGGLETACSILGESFAPWSEATAAVKSVVGGDFIDWNNAPGRTKAEVVAVLRAAAQVR
jgi:hypothetical protein